MSISIFFKSVDISTIDMSYRYIEQGYSPRQLAQSTAWSNGRRLCKGTVDILKVAMRKNVSFNELQNTFTLLMVWSTHLKVILSIDVRLGQFILYLEGGVSNLHQAEFTSFPFLRLLVDMYELLFSYHYLDGQAILQVQHARLANVFQLCTGLAHLGYKVVKKQGKLNHKRNHVLGWTSVTDK